MGLIKSGASVRFQVKKAADRTALGRMAASDVARTVRDLLERQEMVSMVFAAAPSQNEFLAFFCQEKDVDFSRIHAFHMDEYIGLPEDAPQGFGNFLRRRLFEKSSFHGVDYLNGQAEDLAAECRRYAALLRQDPADIVCMGIGENGHIAFNDPHEADFYDPQLVKVVELDEVCRNQQVHDGCFAALDQVPHKALTLTIPALAAARYHFCMVPGAAKMEAVSQTVYGPLNEACPASILRTCRDAVLYVDADSGAAL